MENLDEAYELALQYTRCRMGWRPNSNRVLVMIGDCRPHEKDYSLNKDRIDWTEEILKLRDMNVKINAVQCLRRSYADSFYQKIASATFGQHVTLNDIKDIEKTLMSICYREAGLGMSQSAYQKGYGVPLQNQQTATYTTPTNNTTLDSDSESDDDDEENRKAEHYPAGFKQKCAVALKKGMTCQMCKIAKPPNEFPSKSVTKECRHAPLECLRCVVNYVYKTGRCPREGCQMHVGPDSQIVKLYQAKLDRMFLDYNKVRQQQLELMRPSGECISVSMISGDTEWFTFNANMKVGDLKRELGQKLNLKTEQQKLIYNDNTMKSDARLSDYGIGPNASISLILPLYCIPENLDHVVFDLSWEFPSTNPDFLDATCMAFHQEDFIQVIDWTHPTNKYHLQDSVRHSEQNMTGPGAKTGHQTIHVYLKTVPENITHLYFVLSSWRSPNLSAFHNPSLKFYEASNQNTNLCETTFTHALNSQAVLMCYAVRVGKTWQIYECGAGSLVAGNSKCYNPIRARISDLIRREK